MRPLRRQRPQTGETATSIRRRVFSWPTLLSYGVAIALIGFLVLRFDLDWDRTWQSIRSMDPWLYALALAAYYLSFLFRGARWRILAANAASDSCDFHDSAPRRGRDEKGAGQSGQSHESVIHIPSIPHTSMLIIIGWFVNSVTWLRLGDAYRAYAFAEDSGASFSWSLGTLLAERLLDMVTVAALVVVSVLLLTLTSGLAVSRYIVVAALLMSAVVVLAVIWMRFYGARLARLLPRRLEEAYHRFHEGTLGSFDNLPTVLSLGLIGWLLEMARLYLVVQALDIDVGLALIPIVALGHAILSTVPTPGGVGAVEPGVTGLLLLELSRPDAVAVAITDRSITYLNIVFIGGLLFLARQVVRIRRERTSDSRVQSGSDSV